MRAVTTFIQHLLCGGHHIIVVLQRFAADPVIVSDLVNLDDALKGEDDMLREERMLEMVRRVVRGMLYADDAGVASVQVA